MFIANALPATRKDAIAALHAAFGGTEHALWDCGPAIDPAAPELGLVDILVLDSTVACDRRLMQSMPRLRAIVTPTIGIGRIDLDHATRAGILIANAPTPENISSMAEATLMLMLCARYDLLAAACPQNAKAPRKAASLFGGRIGLVGFGRIAQAVAKRLEGWDVEVVTFTRTPPKNTRVQSVPLDVLLKTSDVVSLHLPLSPKTRHIIAKRELGLMRPDAILVNTARGGLIDEAALADCLGRRAIGGAALDVFEAEPLAPDSPLRKTPRVILTPHCAGHTSEGAASLIQAMLDNVNAILRRDTPTYLANPDALGQERHA